MSILVIKTDGDPYPAKAGSTTRGPNGIDRTIPTNSGARNFADDIDGPDVEVNKKIEDQNKTYSFKYRGGDRNTSISNPQSVYDNDKAIAVSTNGVAIYPPGVNYHPINGSSAPSGYRFNAAHPNISALDDAGGRPETNFNEYRYRSSAFYVEGFGTPVKPNALFKNSSPYYSGSSFGQDYLRHPAVGDFPEGHSKIVGWALDGHPIYGPYGYSNALDPENGTVIPMVSSWEKKSDEQIFLMVNKELNPRPPTGVGGYSKGSFIQDYEYKADGQGTLDQYNGRYCKTPDFKTGTYAYFLTFEPSADEASITLGDPAYPYIIGEYTKEQRSSD